VLLEVFEQFVHSNWILKVKLCLLCQDLFEEAEWDEWKSRLKKKLAVVSKHVFNHQLLTHNSLFYLIVNNCLFRHIIPPFRDDSALGLHFLFVKLQAGMDLLELCLFEVILVLNQLYFYAVGFFKVIPTF